MVNFLMKGVLWQHRQKSNSVHGGRRKGTGVSMRKTTFKHNFESVSVDQEDKGEKGNQSRENSVLKSRNS